MDALLLNAIHVLKDWMLCPDNTYYHNLWALDNNKRQKAEVKMIHSWVFIRNSH